MYANKREALWTKEFLGMSLCNFLLYISQYAMIAALPIVMMAEYGGGEVEAGVAMTFFQIGTVSARPFAGLVIDAVNKRRLMLAVTGAFFLVMAAFVFAASLSAIYGLRLVHGAVFALSTTTAAALAAETSLFYACYAGAIVVTHPFVGRIFDRKGPDYVVYPGLLLFGAGMIFLGKSADMISLLEAAVLLGAGFGAATPAFQTLAVRSAPPARAGVATATYFWSLDISVGLAAAGLGLVAVAYGYAFTYGVVDAVVVLCAALCYAVWRRMRK
ncbi:MFS transporter [Selenomonas sp. F0473]|uniref:MFS transporter n=1 Tax=Selenomonas sp. F0473 TaxID=999423 RepID=UPI00029E989A|nr:MFS transporter [Selenomonas sp. F0473]EKU70583.1 hypothetical protein HMPREF9161_01629 [Selenomonas sp. F0473]